MWKEVTPEREKEIIEEVAKKIVELETELPAKFFFGILFPAAYVVGELGRVFLTSFDVFPIKFEYLFIFEKRENIKTLMQRIDELVEEREMKKEEKKHQERKEGIRSWFKNLF